MISLKNVQLNYGLRKKLPNKDIGDVPSLSYGTLEKAQFLKKKNDFNAKRLFLCVFDYRYTIDIISK